MKKLIKVQSGLKAPKGQFNKFGGYNYRSCEDILEAVKPLVHAEGLHLTLSDEMVEVGGRLYVRASATILDPSNAESVTVTAYAREAETKKGMDESQITGAASSYARKYALNGLFCIDDTKDADSTNTHGKNEQPNEQGKRTSPRALAVKEIYEIAKKKKMTKEQTTALMKETVDKERLNDLTEAELVTYKEALDFV